MNETENQDRAEVLKARAQKSAETRRQRREATRERFRLELNDRDRALTLCRQIRDDENAADADRLEAVKLLLTLKKI